MVLADSHGISRAPCYFGNNLFLKVFDYKTFTFYGLAFQLILLTCLFFECCSTTPFFNEKGFRLVPFRSPLLRKSFLLSFPLATKMFQFARFALSCLYIQQEVHGVASFGNLRIIVCFQLPEAFRRLPRPSSPLNAKVSSVSPFFLELKK